MRRVRAERREGKGMAQWGGGLIAENTTFGVFVRGVGRGEGVPSIADETCGKLAGRLAHAGTADFAGVLGLAGSKNVGGWQQLVLREFARCVHELLCVGEVESEWNLWSCERMFPGETAWVRGRGVLFGKMVGGFDFAVGWNKHCHSLL